MAIDIKFDLVGNPEPPTIILANRNGNMLGQLDVSVESIVMSDKLNDASEFSFTLYKYIDDKITNLWNKVIDFKLVYCKEWDEWFEIKVEIDEATETIKTVFCTQLGKAELSQLNLYNIEINTEKDIERDDYKITILFNENDEESSLLHRLLKDKAPHYSVIHADSTIAKIQRSFSFDDISIDDAFQKIAEEIGCLFVYHSYLNNNGKLQRTISVYDLQQNCNDCGHRGEFTDKCPKCESTNIKNGYGEDTLIFITSEELASNGIQLTTDTDSVKNCFKLKSGDNLMTDTVRNCNPNGTDYIWYFSDSIKEDMPDELVEKLKSYNELYEHYYNEGVSNINTNIVSDYNALVDKYSVYNKGLQKIETPITGYSNLMNAYYNAIDLSLYLESSLMPNIEMSETNAKEQSELLVNSSFSAVAVNTDNIKSVSLATANSAVLSMAKIIVKSTYKTEINTSTLSNDKVWEGNFIITNYSDEEDVAISDTIVVKINNDTETFIKQKIDKSLNKEDTDDLSVSGLFKKDYNDFCTEIKKYALNPLKSFYDACDSCLNVLIEQGAGNKDEKPDLYESLYEPYYKKSTAIANEIKIRENEIAIIEGVYDKTDENNPVLITKGLKSHINECRSNIRDILDLKKYLGEDLWLDFCAYRREDTYSNENYISDGLNNEELFQKALEFYELAENKIYKSSELQHSISTTLNNLLAIPKFKHLVKSFKVGNWIRVQIDDRIFKLRLLEYEIDFGDFDNISVDFSDVTKIKNGITDIQSVIEQTKSMATSYPSVQRQANKGSEANVLVNQASTNGLNSADVRIKNNNNEEVTLGKSGLLCRSYDDITGAYSPEQFRLTHNMMAYTNDDWNTVSTALGKHEYEYYNADKVKKQDVDYGLSAKFVTAGYINGSQIIGGEIYSQNYTTNTGTYMNLNNGNFSWAGGKIKYDGNDLKLNGVNLLWEDIEGVNDKVTQITKDTVTSSYIKTLNLSVGNEIKMGANATISWEQVTDKDSVATKTYVTSQGYQTSSQVTQITKDTVTTTYVNALKITADSVAAENITGTTITGKTISGGTVSGATITGGSLNIGNGNFVVTSGGVLTAKSGSFGGSLDAASGSFKGTLSAVSGTFVNLTAGQSTFTSNKVVINASYTNSSGQSVSKGSVIIGHSGYTDNSGTLWDEVTIMPNADNIGNIGTPSRSWDMLCVKNGAVSSSDRNYKKDISKMDEKQERLFNLLNPVQFKFIDSTHDRFHYGYISQEVEDAIIESGLTTKDFAGFCKDVRLDDNGSPIVDENGNQEYVYSLRYSEFIALNTHMIQKMQSENQKLKERIDSLENMIKQLS